MPAPGPAPATVKFREDVYPVFQSSCNPFSCHAGDNEKTKAGELLNLGQIAGQPLLEETAKLVLKNLIDVDSKAAPGTALVKPGDPARSYLLAVIEYSDGGSECSTITCSTTCSKQAKQTGHNNGNDSR